MDFGLDADQEGLRDEVGALAARRLAAHYQADDRAGEFSPEVARELAEGGLMGLRVPARFGGRELGSVSTGIALEALAAVNFNACYPVLNAALIADILLANADEEQQARWLPPLAAGDILPALCLTEPEHGSDAARIELEARADGAGWTLHGTKTSIMLGTHANAGLVFARTGGPAARGVTALYVPLRDEDGLERRPFRDLGNRGAGRAEFAFRGLRAGREDVVAGEGLGFVQVMRGFDYSRALIGLMCLAAAQASLEEAIAYARERQAFGGPIGRFQGVAFPLVEAATQLRAARHLCFEALWRRDAGLAHTLEANMAKWWAPQLAFKVAHQALLTLGHHGWSEERALGQRLRDVIGLEIGDGTAQIAKLVAARALLGREAAP